MGQKVEETRDRFNEGAHTPLDIALEKRHSNLVHHSLFDKSSVMKPLFFSFVVTKYVASAGDCWSPLMPGPAGCSLCAANELQGSQCVRSGRWFTCYDSIESCCKDGEVLNNVSQEQCVSDAKKVNEGQSQDKSPNTSQGGFDAEECQRAVAKTSLTTNRQCMKNCVELIERGVKPENNSDWSKSCMTAHWHAENGRTVIDGTCFEKWVYGYSEPNNLASYKLNLEAETPALCQALCQEDNDCINWLWVSPIYAPGTEVAKRCMLKSKTMVEKALEMITKTQPPKNLDVNYCNYQMGYTCQNLYKCLPCEGERRCVWESDMHISGWKYCDHEDSCDANAYTELHTPLPDVSSQSNSTVQEAYNETLLTSTELASSKHGAGEDHRESTTPLPKDIIKVSTPLANNDTDVPSANPEKQVSTLLSDKGSTSSETPSQPQQLSSMSATTSEGSRVSTAQLSSLPILSTRAAKSTDNTAKPSGGDADLPSRASTVESTKEGIESSKPPSTAEIINTTSPAEFSSLSKERDPSLPAEHISSPSLSSQASQFSGTRSSPEEAETHSWALATAENHSDHKDDIDNCERTTKASNADCHQETTLTGVVLDSSTSTSKPKCPSGNCGACTCCGSRDCACCDKQGIVLRINEKPKHLVFEVAN